MIEAQTLETVKEIQDQLTKAASLMDNLESKEKGNWLPGHGEKPLRAHVLKDMVSTLKDMKEELDKLWS